MSEIITADEADQLPPGSIIRFGRSWYPLTMDDGRWRATPADRGGYTLDRDVRVEVLARGVSIDSIGTPAAARREVVGSDSGDWDEAMDARVARLADTAGVPRGGWEVVIDDVVRKLAATPPAVTREAVIEAVDAEQSLIGCSGDAVADRIGLTDGEDHDA